MTKVSFTWDPDRDECLQVVDKGFGSQFVYLDWYAISVAAGEAEEGDQLSIGDTIDLNDFLDDLEDWTDKMRRALAGPLQQQLESSNRRGTLNDEGVIMLKALRERKYKLDDYGYPIGVEE